MRSVVTGKKNARGTWKHSSEISLFPRNVTVKRRFKSIENHADLNNAICQTSVS